MKKRKRARRAPFFLSTVRTTVVAVLFAVITVVSWWEYPPSLTLAQAFTSLSQVPVKILDPPDFKKTPVRSVTTHSGLKLRLLSARRNKITDEKEWFAEHKFAHPLARPGEIEAPEFVRRQFHGLMLVSVIPSPGRLLLIYGKDYPEGVLLVSQRLDNNEFEYALDFSNYRFAPENREKYLEFLSQHILWASQVGGVLYVSHGHLSYAKESFGMNAYVTAIDVRSMKALWHSAPLVSNAWNFEVCGDYLITGYGYTAEPDFLFLLRRDTGEAVARIPIKSQAEYIFLRNDRLYVRTYDTDYIFQVLQTK